MKKTILAFVFITVLAVLLQAQEITIQNSAPFTYAYMECKGSYAQIPDKVNEFMGIFFKQGLMPLGSFFGMYLNSPGEIKEEELQWRLGFPVAGDAAVAAPLQKGECAFSKVAVYPYVGPYDKSSESYAKIMEFIDQNGYQMAGPIIERYLDMDPMSVKPEALRTEIIVPVEKK